MQVHRSVTSSDGLDLGQVKDAGLHKCLDSTHDSLPRHVGIVRVVAKDLQQSNTRPVKLEASVICSLCKRDGLYALGRAPHYGES
jgi:hypothetical protein